MTKYYNQKLLKESYTFVIGERGSAKTYAMNKEAEKRICSECGKEMTQGYCIEAGLEYYCSDECLHKHYTEEEWQDMYEDGGDSYYTEWEEKGEI